MRRVVLSLIFLLVASSYLHSTAAATIMANNKTSKEKLVVVQTLKTNSSASFLNRDNTLGVTAKDIEEWSKVNVCEMGGGKWDYQGSLYSGGLGIMNSSWVENGGLTFGPTAGWATEKEQIYVAKRIVGSYNVPDQYGCGKGW